MKHKITLRNGKRSFSAWSSHPQTLVGEPLAYERVIFLLHGFPDNNDSYNEMTPILRSHFEGRKEKSVLIIAPLMRGYEALSQGQSNEYCMYELAQDVLVWIQEVNPQKDLPVHIVGHDWGAIVAFKTASNYPELITSMVTLAIPYMTNLRPWHFLWYFPKQIWCLSYMLRMQSALFYRPAFGDVCKPGYLDSLWRFWSPDWDFSREIGPVRQTLAEPGVLDAATAYYRNLIPWKNLQEFGWPVDFEKVPTLILGGEKDGCMLAALYDLEFRLLASTPRVKVQVLNGVGHFLHREDSVKVSELVCDWFDKYDL
ncbi:epoxide hydrolase [Metschnikowia aff. pulcherrima]|uniref:Epoxide hydrolase n=1 Tax=Metschnikowia aff. pulcherrima TaxID=2163413 RepID=A0A4P6XDT6_9ASCO|nr:epoxide hydrolase [Metschnikowia aff. pulcherrima]